MTDSIINFLKQLIAFQSISSDKRKAESSRKAAEFIRDNLNAIGVQVQVIENEREGYNPLIFGKLGEDREKMTLLFYSHYDVQPAKIEDGWDTDPFTLTEKDDGYLYGRGVDDDKGPIAATYFAIKELLEDKEALPVNIRFLYEGEEESSSLGFEETVTKHKDFFGKVDGILILDSAWFTDHRPSIDYGARGIAYMGIEISGPKQDQHSGLVGGTIREPMTDLIYLLSKLIDLDGRILIDGFYSKVKQITEEERKLYENLEFSLEDYKKSLGLNRVLDENPIRTLMNMWRNPSLTIHGIQGAFSEPGMKTVVPSSIIGKVSMRLVPDQDPSEISELFTQYVMREFEKINSPNKLRVTTLGTGDWWYGNVQNDIYKAAAAAIEEYWNLVPAFSRSGGSLPIISSMEKMLKAPALILGVGQASDGAHSQNERLRLKNLIGGKEVIKILLQNVSKVAK
ncbi:MAG: M20/M25/M40 family metallo-hydrolase [Candidatus Hodarchaeota archaeon]